MNNNIKFLLAVCSFIAGITFGLLGIFIDPTGQIHSSVLIFCALLFILSCTFLGLHVDFDLTKNKFTTNDKKESDKENES